MEYLYGAAIQGIQSYIFSTNALKEIVGASEIVENICTNAFKKYLEQKPYEIIVSAAGNIKLKFQSQDDMADLVENFPMYVQQLAPGITVSQAVVEVEGQIEKGHFDKLEQQLKTQRNIPAKPAIHSALGIERDRKSGLSASGYEYESNGEKKPFDLSRIKKCKNSKMNNLANKMNNTESANENLFPKEFSDIINTKNSSWLAVIHADGNNLGKTIQSLSGNESVIDLYKTFSKNLNEATCLSAKNAFDKEISPDFKANYKLNNNTLYPLRPVIIGGDDLTVICRADLALPFIKTYLDEFEKNSESIVGQKITACAGIAFIKEKYPFHYAIDLAENLCAYAKEKSKGFDEENAPSSVMFHKVQSGFVESYQEIKSRELYAQASKMNFCFGPYYLNQTGTSWTIDDLLETKREMIKNEKFPLSGLRKWLSELHFDKGSAELLWKRIEQLTESKSKPILSRLKTDSNTPVYDLLSIISLEKGGN